MPGAVRIRKIRITEASLLSAIAWKAYIDHYRHLWFDLGEWYKKRCFTQEVMEQELADPNNLFYIAYENDRPVGFLKLRIHAVLETEPGKDAIELERIYLTKAATGKGIGGQLLKLTISVAEDHNKELIWLKAMDSSSDAIAFYKKMGFVQCGATKLDFTQMKGEYRGMVIMKKELP